MRNADTTPGGVASRRMTGEMTTKFGGDERPDNVDDQHRADNEITDEENSGDDTEATSVVPAAAADLAEPSEPAGVSRFATDYVPPPPRPIFKNRRALTSKEAEEQRKRRATRRRRRRNAGLLLVGLGLLILLAGGWVTWRTFQAYSHLQAASDQVSQLQTEIKDITSIDLKATDATVGRLQAESADAESAVSDPFFRAAGYLPWVGPNLHAISEVTATVDSLSTNVVPSLVRIAKTLNPSALAPKNGVIGLASIEAASPLLQKADQAVRDSRIRLAAINRSEVVEQVNSAVLKLSGKLDQAAAVTGAGARVARLLPPMLGSQGARTYLVVFQNLAEVRATGGIFGSFAAVRVDHGKISIVDQGAGSRTLKTFNPPIAPLEANTIKLYSHQMAIYPQDVNLTPDFPTAAELFAKMYTARRSTAIDGVIATDPVALSYALRGTPGISVGEGLTLNSKTVVPILLSTAYSKFAGEADQTGRDSFLAHASTAAFTAVMSGRGDASVIMSGLKQAVRERRVLAWSANASEQQDIAQTGLAGRLSATPDNPSIGVFFNDSTMSKLDYYLSESVKVTPGQCRSDGRRQLNVAVTLAYNPPSSGLPSYVLGPSEGGRHYIVQTNVMVFAPVGGGVIGASQDNNPVASQRGEERSREVSQVSVSLKPGASTVLTVAVLAPPANAAVAQPITPALVLTPAVHPSTVSIAAYQSC